VDVRLTPSGLAAYEGVLALTYAYLGMLEAHGPQRWVWEEDARVRVSKFRFSSKGQPMDAATAAASALALAPPHAALTKDRLLRECTFPSTCMHGQLKQEERTARYNAFRNFETRILVATNIFGRGIDVEKVNVVINYDFPDEDDKSGEPPADQYLHRVGRAGRFGTKGLAISFISSLSFSACSRTSFSFFSSSSSLCRISSSTRSFSLDMSPLSSLMSATIFSCSYDASRLSSSSSRSYRLSFSRASLSLSSMARCTSSRRICSRVMVMLFSSIFIRRDRHTSSCSASCFLTLTRKSSAILS
jgi:hypothetical protein